MNDSPGNYRPDIDGLRAVAILPVVGFHAFPSAVPGGFVGVDIFFVISGYLISLIVLQQLDAGTFSFRHFYARRVRRLFPALILVLIGCLAWGWLRLFASDYASLGKHTAAGAGFGANLVLWSEAGYFDSSSETKPLLHLWSLGIEEQFYLFWPALLYLTWGRWPRLIALIVTLSVLSFCLNVAQVRTDAVAAFYSPLTRLWELLLGGMLAFAMLKRRRLVANDGWLSRTWRQHHAVVLNVVASLGIAAIVASLFLFDAGTSFPGWRAALPAGGALLLLASGPEAWWNRQLLARRPLVWLGLISYPLYLWHWPLLAFARLSAVSSIGVRVVLVVSSVALAALTYLLLERPIRSAFRAPAMTLALCLLMIGTGTRGYVTYARAGFEDRLINRSDQAHFLGYYEGLRKRGLAESYRAECDFMDWQTENTRSAIDHPCTAAGRLGTIFLWGDSHAQALSAGLRAVLPADFQLAQVTSSACAPRLHELQPARLGGRCVTANEYALTRIAAIKPQLVVLAQIMAHQESDWVELARALRARGAQRVILVGPMPQWLPTLPAVVVNHYWAQDFSRVSRGLNTEVFTTDAILRSRLANSPEIEYVSLIDALCDDAGCLASLPGHQRQLLVVDNSHLSPLGSLYVGENILRPMLVSRQ